MLRNDFIVKAAKEKQLVLNHRPTDSETSELILKARRMRRMIRKLLLEVRP